MNARIWQRSIRLRLTLWYTILMVTLLVLLISVILASQQFFSHDYFQKRLIAAREEAEASLTLDGDGNPAFTTEISDDDVRITVLDASGNLLLGTHSFNFLPRQDRLRIRVRNKGGNWYVMDFPIVLNGMQFWLRCYMSSASSSQTLHTLLVALFGGVPVLLLLTLVGGNLIAKHAMRPLIEITATAESISGSDDLDRRIVLNDRTDEVGRLANAFNHMFERLQRSMEREKRFISDASHELRTPISVISAQSQFALSNDATPEDKDAALSVIQNRSERAGRMLNQMLLLSRMDSQRLPLHREQLMLNDLIEGICEELNEAVGAREMSLHCDIQSNIEINGDELLLTRMLTNLIQNAIQYGKPGGHIEVKLLARDKLAVLSVIDDGLGIPEADIPRIWDRFYQVSKNGESKGSGLGLPIVRWIVEAHGGSIRLESELGVGSKFIVELPM